ncbi:MAG: alpha/beta hydrolase [Saccharospirillum sp.]|nr:alpha/beta hydrolase [Saccharospirillum sp.]
MKKTPLAMLALLTVLALVLVIAGCQSLPDGDQNMNTAPQTHLLEVPHGTLSYDDHGEGPLMLMLPGLGDLRQSYRLLAPEMAAAGFRVVTMDLRGHGDSSIPWPEYTTTSVAEDVIALLAHLDAGPAILVGNSFSAGVAVWLSTEHPELVASMIMIGPFVRDHGKPSLMIRTTMGVLFNGPWRVQGWALFHSTLFTHQKPADYKDYRRALVANLSEPGRFDAVKAMIDRSDAEVDARLSKVQLPTLIIMGSADPDFKDPIAEAEAIASATQGQTAIIAKAGHYPQAEMPFETAQAILQFLQAATIAKAS